MVRTWSNDLCKILAIGDIKYFDDLEIEWQELIHRVSRNKYMKTSRIWPHWTMKSGTPFEYSKIYVTLLWSISSHYSCGGSDYPKLRWNWFICSHFKHSEDSCEVKEGNVLYPEASFIANVKIAEMILEKENCLIIKKPEPDDFFISLEQVRSLYKEGGLEIDQTNVFYITPVGNPTGNKVGNGNLSQILQWIHEFDANAILSLIMYTLDSCQIVNLINSSRIYLRINPSWRGLSLLKVSQKLSGQQGLELDGPGLSILFFQVSSSDILHWLKLDSLRCSMSSLSIFSETLVFLISKTRSMNSGL